MLLGDIIKRYREEHEMSLQDFADLIGTSRSYIHMLEKNINPSTNKPISPSIETLKSLANAMNIELDYLLKQLEENQNIYLDENEYKKQFSLIDNKQAYPLLGTVKGGYDYLVAENIVGHVTIDNNVTDVENYYALKVTGDSMYPLMGQDDIIIVHRQTTFENGQTCIILINGDEATVKNVFKTDLGIKLVALNPYVPPREFTYKEMEQIPVKIIGIVKEVRNRSSFR